MRKTHYEKTIAILVLLCGITWAVLGQNVFGKWGFESDMRNPNPHGGAYYLSPISGPHGCEWDSLLFQTYDSPKGQVWEHAPCKPCLIRCYRSSEIVPCTCYRLTKYTVTIFDMLQITPKSVSFQRKYTGV